MLEVEKKIRKRNTFIHVIDNAVKNDVYDILKDFTEDKLHALISYRDVIRSNFEKVLALNEEIVDLLESEEEITSEVEKQFQF